MGKLLHSLLEGDEVLLVLVVRLSVRDVRDVHHCGDTWTVSVSSFSTLAAHLIRREIAFWPIHHLPPEQTSQLFAFGGFLSVSRLRRVNVLPRSGFGPFAGNHFSSKLPKEGKKSPPKKANQFLWC